MISVMQGHYMLYKLSYEATQLGAGQFVGLIKFVPVKDSHFKYTYSLKTTGLTET